MCAQIFTDGFGLMYAYPMKKKAEAGLQLEKLIMTLKMIPDMINTDGAVEETGGDWTQTLEK
jgi:hypothetical protein